MKKYDIKVKGVSLKDGIEAEAVSNMLKNIINSIPQPKIFEVATKINKNPNIIAKALKWL